MVVTIVTFILLGGCSIIGLIYNARRDSVQYRAQPELTKEEQQSQYDYYEALAQLDKEFPSSTAALPYDKAREIVGQVFIA